MATRNGKKITMTWRELSELLSKAQVLLPDEDIGNLTLVKPRALLIIAENMKPVVSTESPDQ